MRPIRIKLSDFMLTFPEMKSPQRDNLTLKPP